MNTKNKTCHDFQVKQCRGVFTQPSHLIGSLGFADLFSGDGQWNILIRSLEAEAVKAQNWVAGFHPEDF